MARRAEHSRPPPISVSTILNLHSSHVKPLDAFQSIVVLYSLSLLFAITHYPPSVWNIHPLLLCLVTSPQGFAFLWNLSWIPTESCPISFSCFYHTLVFHLLQYHGHHMTNSLYVSSPGSLWLPATEGLCLFSLYLQCLAQSQEMIGPK